MTEPSGQLVPIGPRKKRRAGRKRKLNDPDVAQRFFDAIRLGVSQKDAADYAGVSVDAVARQLQHSADFADMLRASRTFGKIELLAIIHEHARRDWRAAAWKLARGFPDEWGDRKPNIITAEQLQHTIGSIVAVLMQELPPDLVAVIRRRMDDIIAAIERDGA